MIFPPFHLLQRTSQMQKYPCFTNINFLLIIVERFFSQKAVQDMKENVFLLEITILLPRGIILFSQRATSFIFCVRRQSIECKTSNLVMSVGWILF